MSAFFLSLPPYAADLAIIAVVALCTLLTRVLPFLLFGRGGRQPAPFILYLGRVLPAAVMAILVVYCLRSSDFSAAVGFVPQAVAVATVAALHLWKRNDLLSIAGGTAVYMLLLRVL